MALNQIPSLKTVEPSFNVTGEKPMCLIAQVILFLILNNKFVFFQRNTDVQLMILLLLLLPPLLQLLLLQVLLALEVIVMPKGKF